MKKNDFSEGLLYDNYYQALRMMKIMIFFPVGRYFQYLRFQYVFAKHKPVFKHRQQIYKRGTVDNREKK